MRILGIDPGTRNCGWAILGTDGITPVVLDLGRFITPKGSDQPTLLAVLYAEWEALLLRYRPDEVACESLFFHANVSSAMAVAEVRGALLLFCGQHGLPVSQYTPQRMKKAMTGSGKADKKQMRVSVEELVGVLDVPKSNDHAIDAAAAGLVRLRDLSLIA